MNPKLSGGQGPSFEGLESRLYLDGEPTFATPLPQAYVITTDGRGLTIGIDGQDDGERLTITAVSSDPDNLDVFVPENRTAENPDGNRYALMHFTESDGLTPVGDILVQLFEGRSPNAAERFIDLATNGVVAGELDPQATAFYTDVVVHRVIPDFVIQTGDAVNGNGTGGSGLGPFEETFDPAVGEPGNLSYAGPGVLAYANSGPGTSDCQIFITAAPTTWLNDGYVIFGHIIAGQDVYDDIINRPRDAQDRPLDPPLLASVEIIESPQDTTMTLVASENFTAPAEVTVTLTDEQFNSVSQVVTVYPPPAVRAIADVSFAPGEPTDVDFQIDYAEDWATVSLTDNYDGQGDVILTYEDGAETSWYVLHVALPAEYDGRAFDITVSAAIAAAQDFSPSESTFQVDLGNRPTISDPGLVQLDVGEATTVSLTIEDDDADQFDLAIDSDMPQAVLLDPDAREVAIVPPAEFVGLCSVTVTAIETGINVAFDNLAPASLTFYISTMSISQIDTQNLNPGESTELNFEVFYSEQAELDVSATSDYAGTGQVDLQVNPAGQDNQYVLTLTLPDEYNGLPFTVTVSALPQDHPDAPPITTSFQVACNQRPTIEDLGEVFVGAAQTATLTLTIVDDDKTDLDVTINAIHPLAQVSDLILIDPDTHLYEFTLTAPADSAETFEVTITAIETEYMTLYPHLSPATYTFEVRTMVIGDIPNADDLAPGQTGEVAFEITYAGDEQLNIWADSPDYAGGGQPTFEAAEGEEPGQYVLSITMPDEYDGRAFTVTVYAEPVGYDHATPATGEFQIAFNERPYISDPGPVFLAAGESRTVSFTVADADRFALDVTADADNAGVIVSGIQRVNGNTYQLTLQAPADLTEVFGVTITAVESEYNAAYANLAPSSRTFTVSPFLGLETPLADTYGIDSDGRGLTIGIDGFAADSGPVTVTYTDAEGLDVFMPTGNRYALLHFTESDGVTPIGDILVQLLADRCPNGTERFVSLATMGVTRKGNFSTTITPFYTDVAVHRVIPQFMLQSGDATSGDGFGASGLKAMLVETFGPAVGESGNLSFAGPGVLAYANTGEPGTSDSQFFVTDVPTGWLDDGYVIFGQMISGWDVQADIINHDRNTNDRPYNPPLLNSVEILQDSPQDATMTLVATDEFTGQAELTLTLTDQAGHEVNKTITIIADDQLTVAPTIDAVLHAAIAPSESTDVSLDVYYEGDRPLNISVVSGDEQIPVQVTAGELPDQYVLEVGLPADYDGRSFEITFSATLAGVGNIEPVVHRMGYSFGLRPEILGEETVFTAPGQQLISIPITIDDDDAT
ncbi:MAG: peptidylprolyl isomerase, partial [Planctomycetes bacterium]|nr:peptidylprolyl isomerase [Planctomycetota bacterium]